MTVEPGALIALDSLTVDVLSDNVSDNYVTKTPFAQVDFHVRFGDPGREIAAFAESQHADLIVMPSHGRTGLSRILIGSVAERVVRLAHCPVLILK